MYSGLLTDCYRNPSYKKIPEVFYAHSEAINATCGDHIHLYKRDDGQLFWDGEGCMICQSSAELLCRLINHQESFLLLEKTLLNPPDKPAPPELSALIETLSTYPARSKCVLLAWQAYRKFLTDTDSND